MDFSFLDAFDETFDRTAVQRFARALWGIEASFCYRDFARSARFCADALRGAGARGVRCIPIAADGRTASGDFVMPQAWDVDAARLEIAARPDAPAEALADLRESRFAVANRCGPTPRAGVEGPVVHVENPARMPGVAGAFVFVDTLYPAAVRERAVRGGAWSSTPGNCRASYRHWFTPDSRDDILGLRLVVVVGGLIQGAEP